MSPAMATRTFLQLVVAIGLILSARARIIRIKSTCSGVFPVVNNTGPGCSIPAYVDPEEFGDNLHSTGRLFLRRIRGGIRLTVDIKNLSRPDLVLTAWFIWARRNNDLPEIFNIASVESPVAPSSGHFTAGLGPEANSLKYITRKRAVLGTYLDFDPTKPNQGPLVGARPSFQKDIPGIEKTPFKQFVATPNGRAIPITANFLRKFNPENGFQKLDTRGRPKLVRSPIAVLGVAVIAHVDRITHGLHPGLLDADHFEVAFFDLAKSL